MKKMKKLPENFDFMYSFIEENLEEIKQLEEKDMDFFLYWMRKLSDFQVNYKNK